jgi:hypothetical protein
MGTGTRSRVIPLYERILIVNDAIDILFDKNPNHDIFLCFFH